MASSRNGLTKPGSQLRANGEGNICKRKDGRWEGRYTTGHDPETRKAIYKNVLARTQKKCKEKLAAALEQAGKYGSCLGQNKNSKKLKEKVMKNK